MVKKKRQWSPEEKEKIIEDIQNLGVVAGCRKHDIYATTYYDWLARYETNGLKGLQDRRSVNVDRQLKQQEKEIKLLKEIIAEKELKIKMQEELLKKKMSASKRKEKS